MMPRVEAAFVPAWPRDELEDVPCCVVCGSVRRVRWHTGLSDRVFRVAPGLWTFWRCEDCGAATLGPRPTEGSIARAYGTYYTHGEPERSFLVPGDRPDLRLKRALHLSYYNRFLGHAQPGELPLGWLAIAASRRRRVRAGKYIRDLPGPGAGGRELLDVGCGDGGFLRVARAR
jgi:hypothetical protein